jgi:hypothetical protein
MERDLEKTTLAGVIAAVQAPGNCTRKKGR